MRQPDVARRLIAGEFTRHGRDLERQIPVDRDALFGEIDGRLHDFSQLHAAEFLERETETVDVTGHRHRQRPVHVAVILHRGPAEQIAGDAAGQRIVGGIERARRDRTEIDHCDAVFFREINQHEADAAEAAVPRLDRGEREAGRDRRIHGVAAGGENARAGLPGNAILRGDDAAARARDGLAHVPVLHEMFRHGGETPR